MQYSLLCCNVSRGLQVCIVQAVQARDEAATAMDLKGDCGPIPGVGFVARPRRGTRPLAGGRSRPQDDAAVGTLPQGPSHVRSRHRLLRAHPAAFPASGSMVANPRRRSCCRSRRSSGTTRPKATGSQSDRQSSNVPRRSPARRATRTDRVSVPRLQPDLDDEAPEWAAAQSSMRRLWDETPEGARTIQRLLKAIADLRSSGDGETP